MSKMSELDIQIQERVERGENPAEIAYALEIPFEMVYDSIKRHRQDQENIDQ